MDTDEFDGCKKFQWTKVQLWAASGTNSLSRSCPPAQPVQVFPWPWDGYAGPATRSSTGVHARRTSRS